MSPESSPPADSPPVGLAAESPADSAIGSRLRAARERMGLSVIQASEKLHLDPGTLEALETDRFELLGAPVYVRGHMRRYAEFVGERPELLQERYVARLTTNLEPDLRQVPTSIPPGPRKLFWPALIAAGVLVLGGVLWWALSQPRKPPQAAGASSLTGPVEPLTEEASPAAADGATDAATGAVASRTATQLRLTFKEDSWAEIYDADGQRLFYDVGAGGTEHLVSGAAPLRITLANPRGVTLQINGKNASAPSTGEFLLGTDGRVMPRAP